MPDRPRFTRAPAALVAAFRAAVPKGAEVRSMFGYPAAFANGNMFAGVFADQVFVRLAPAERDELLASRKATPFAPMAGRPMKEYVVVARGEVPAKTLAPFIERAHRHASTLPTKAPKQRA